MCQAVEKCNCSAFKKFLNGHISVPMAHLMFWPVFLIGFIADLWTKSAVFKWLGSISPQRHSIIDGFFQFVLVENRGAAWGIASGKTIPLIIISSVAIVAVFGIFLFNRKPQGVIVFALALFAAGICGNLYDRIFNAGRVRDFIDFYYKDIHFPAFNIADSMLTVAVGILILVTIFMHQHEEEKVDVHTESRL